MAFPSDPPSRESFFDRANGVENSVSLGNEATTRDRYQGIKVGMRRLVWRAKPTAFLTGLLADYDSRPGEFTYDGDQVVYTERPRFEHRTDMGPGYFDVFCDLAVQPDFGERVLQNGNARNLEDGTTQRTFED